MEAESLDARGGTHVDAACVLEIPSVAGTILFIAVLKLSLVIAGFERTWRWIRSRSQRCPIIPDVSAAGVKRVEYAVALACAIYPGRAACLERSLTLYWYLRRRGVAVRYRMGVQAYPFMAHAWVEYDGQPVNDILEHIRRFRPIEGLAA